MKEYLNKFSFFAFFFLLFNLLNDQETDEKKLDLSNALRKLENIKINYSPTKTKAPQK